MTLRGSLLLAALLTLPGLGRAGDDNYFPAGAKGHMLLHVVGGSGAVRWFNPRTGEWKDGGLEPPDAEDWAVVVRPAGGKDKP